MSSGFHHAQIQIQTHPDPEIDPLDPQAPRRHLMDRLGGSGDTGVHLFFFFADRLEETAHRPPASPEEAMAVALTWQQLGVREGVLRSFRQGEAPFYDRDGALRRAACLFEWTGAEWWLAFALLDAPGGAPRPLEWREMKGQGLSALPLPLRGWLPPSPRPRRPRDPQAPPAPPRPQTLDIQMLEGPRPPDLPDDLSEIARHLGAETDLWAQIPQQKPAFLVLLLRGDRMERWEFIGVPPRAPEDLVRAVAAQGALPELVSMSFVALSRGPDGVERRALITMVERGGQRVLRQATLTLTPGGATRLSEPEVGVLQAGPPETYWIGVPPHFPIQLSAQDWESGAPDDA